MSFVTNIADVSYDHADTAYDVRVRDLYVDRDFVTPDPLVVDNLKVDGALTLATVGGIDSTPLNFYRAEQLTLNITGAFTNTCACRAVKVGNLIQLSIASSIANCTNAAAAVQIAIPVGYRPVFEVTGTAGILNNSATVPAMGTWQCSAGGVLSLFSGLTPGTFFTLAGPCGLPAGYHTFSWTI